MKEKNCWVAIPEVNRSENNYDVSFTTQKDIFYYRELGVRELVTILKDAHAQFENKAVPEILQLLHACHKNFPDYQMISSKMILAFQSFFQDLVQHFKEEENGFFSYALELNQTIDQQFIKGAFLSGDKAKSEVYSDNHAIIWEDFNNLQKLIRLYKEMIGPDLSVNMIEIKLHSLKKELELHDSIESQVLVIKVLFLEKSLKKMI